MRFTQMHLGRMLLKATGKAAAALRTPEDLDAEFKKRQNITASNNFYNISRIMRAVGADDVVALYAKNAGGEYDAARWIEDGALPGGGRDSSHALRSPASRMSYYNSLSSVANPTKNKRLASKVPAEAREYFLSRSKALSEEVKGIQEENKLSERELEAILPWEDIQRMYRERRDGLDPQDRLLVDMYLCCCEVPEGAPRRLDYGEVSVYHRGSRGAAAAGSGDSNYVVIDRKSRAAAAAVTLTLRNFKTYRHYGEYTCVLPRRLGEEIARSVRDDPRDVLFYKHCGSSCRKKEGIKSNTFGVRLSSAMEKLTGKAIGVSNLRKSFITWLYGQSDRSEKELKEFANAMGHSPEMARLYRKINIDDSRL